MPSPWRVQKTAYLLLLAAIIGAPRLHRLIKGSPHLHHHLANTPRKRKPQIPYPLRTLF